jgi:hypothetical protein
MTAQALLADSPLTDDLRSLRLCNAWWGASEIRHEPPLLEVFEDVLYLPFRAGEPWGLYDREGRPIEGAVDRHGPAQVTFAQVLSSDLPPGTVVDEAPEDLYVYGGRMTAHYGHFLLNMLSRYWPCAGGSPPEGRILYQGDPGRWFDTAFIADAFGGLGLHENDFARFERPTRIPRVLVPHPALLEQTRVHAVFRELCVRLGRSLVPTPPARNDRPAYLTKLALTSGIGRFVNEDRLVARLEAAGVEVVSPERLSLAAQVGLLTERRVVAGVAGSGFHTALLAERSADLICLNSIAHVNSNFRLCDLVRGAEGAYWWPPGAEPLPAGEDPAFLTSYRLPDPVGAAEDLLRLMERAGEPAKAPPPRRLWRLPFGRRSRA